MAPGTARPALPALLALIGALLPGLGGAQTSAHPPEAIIPRGGSIQVNCSTSCDQPPILGLETQLSKKEVAHGDHWKVFELSDVQEDSHPICFANCHTQTTAAMTLTVYCEWLGPGGGTRQAWWGRGGRVGVSAGQDSPGCSVVGPELTH
uniref:Intercellular adhesion molecule N-terminal domain-containing protein n=1 Tax=Ursus americanus TaxID=9643 RepID=A0A452QDR0_URSAM